MKKIVLHLGALSLIIGLLAILGASTAFAASTTPAISSASYKSGVNRIFVRFNVPVWSDTALTTGLAADGSDFTYTDAGADGMITISSVAHTAGSDWAMLTMNAVAAGGDAAETINAKANSIFTVGGALSEALVTIASDTVSPTMSAATMKDTIGKVLVTFSEPVFGANDGTTAIDHADIENNNESTGNCAALSAGLHVAGNDWAAFTCTAVNAGADIGTDTIDFVDAGAGVTTVWDALGNIAAVAENQATTADTAAPVFAKVHTGDAAAGAETCVGCTKMLVRFDEPVFNTATMTALTNDLVYDDFIYTDNDAGGKTLSSTGADTVHTVDQKWVVLTLATSAVFTTSDLTAGTVDTIDQAADDNDIYDAFGNAKVETPKNLADETNPVITNIVFNQASGANTLAFTYSEKVSITGLTTASATMAASTATVGDMLVADIADVDQIQGFGAFATKGNVTLLTGLNSLAINSGQTTITITIAGGTNGYIVNTGTTAPSGVFTPEITGVGIVDLEPNAPNSIEITSIQSTITTTTAWDLTKPTITAGVLTDAYINATTTAPGKDGKADTLTLTASETLKAVADSADTRSDFALTSNPTEFGSSLTVTSASAAGSSTAYVILFSGANIYYDLATFTATAAADEWSLMDRAGNIFATTSKVCASGYVCTGGTGNYAVTTVSIEKPSTRDSSAPAKPTAVTAVMTTDGKVTLAWTDPTATDLSKINIFRAKNGAVVTGDVYATVTAGTKTYTDSDVVAGDIVEYILKALDTSNNASGVTDSVKITVTAPIVEEEAVVEEETPAEEEAVVEEETEQTDEEAAAEEEVTVTTTGGTTVTLTDIGTSWAKTEIEGMTEKNIVQGNPNGTFKPDSNINRAEVSALLHRVLGLSEPTAPALSPFVDVAKTSWYAGYVDKLKALAIIKGNPDGTYKPSASINRAEFLSLALRTYYYMANESGQAEIDMLKAGAKTTKYADLKTAWYTPDVTASTELGFIQGSTCTAGTCFNAEASITRAEATKILYNMFYTLLE